MSVNPAFKPGSCCCVAAGIEALYADSMRLVHHRFHGVAFPSCSAFVSCVLVVPHDVLGMGTGDGLHSRVLLAHYMRVSEHPVH